MTVELQQGSKPSGVNVKELSLHPILSPGNYQTGTVYNNLKVKCTSLYRNFIKAYHVHVFAWKTIKPRA